jgi:DivIVA domain-containing protein
MREPISPRQLREMRFTTRLRGFDRDEVRDVMDHVAYDVDLLLDRVRHLQAENRRLREQSNAQSGKPADPNPMDSATDQAVQLFGQAQLVADNLIEDAEQRARELLSTTRSEQRSIMDEAHEVAKRAVAHVSATTRHTASKQEIQYVRSVAEAAQLQFRAVLDALNDQVDKLGEMPQIDAESVPPAIRTGMSEMSELPAGSEYDPPFVQRKQSRRTP